jgi:hypothetical protein
MEGRCFSQAKSITKSFFKPEAPIATLSALEQIREKRN